ncbi:MAG: sulfatase-like hydrolase/transferase [Pirellulales bacterium]
MRILAAILVFQCCQLFAHDKPNILIIVSDDHGYADVGFNGGNDVPTPHFDKLASSGVRCTNGYVTYPVCSPSRAGFLTGRYQARFGHENNPVYDPLDSNEGLPLTEKILPEYLKVAGYATGWIGKWHLGSSPAHVPWVRGFDESFGFIGGGHRFMDWKPNERQYTLPLIRAGKDTTEVPAHLTTALGDEAAAFVRRHQKKPWMLYLPFNAPHTPHEPTAERLARFENIADVKRRRYLAQVSLLDDAIGTVIAALDETGQRGRTLVFFFSDNGGHTPSGSSNGPLRAMKGTLYEGGIRVPFLVSWPDKLPAARTYDQPVISLDLFATALAAAGVPMPTDKVYDSVNLLPHLTGELNTPPHDRLFWRLRAKDFAVREGDWKMVALEGQQPQLFNLANDLRESSDVAAIQPEITQRLMADLDQWKAQLVAPVFPGSSVKNEDWGPGGANQKNAPKNKAEKP